MSEKEIKLDPVEKKGLPDNPLIEKGTIKIDPEKLKEFLAVLQRYVETYRPDLLEPFKNFINSHARNRNFLYFHYLASQQEEGRKISYQTYASKYFPTLLKNISTLAKVLRLRSMTFKRLEMGPHGIRVIE